MNTQRTLSALALAALAPQAALGAGFQINEHNAKATARAGAVFATTDDASAIFYNPAGITNVKGSQILLGLTLIAPSATYEGAGPPAVGGTAGTYSAISDMVPIPNVYLARELSDKAWFGFGFYAPYGLGIEWEDPDNFVGRTVVERLSLRTFFFTPAVALKLADNVSIGVSVSLVPATVYLKRTLGATDNFQPLFDPAIWGAPGRVELSGSGFGVGANAGIQATFLDHLKLGFAFRSAVGIDFTGNADFQVPDSAPTLIKANFPDGPVNAAVTLPHSFAIGIGWADGALTVEAAANLTLWESYDQLAINFESGLPTPQSASPRNWSATPTFRLGGQYEIEVSDSFSLTPRVGGGFDMTPAPDETVDPTLPDRNRLIFTGGLGANIDMINVDFGYMGLLLFERPNNSSNFPGDGTYPGGFVHVLGVSAGVSIE